MSSPISPRMIAAYVVSYFANDGSVPIESPELMRSETVRKPEELASDCVFKRKCDPGVAVKYALGSKEVDYADESAEPLLGTGSASPSLQLHWSLQLHCLSDY